MWGATAVTQGEIEKEGEGKRPAWEFDGVRPSLVKSDNEGRAFLYPVTLTAGIGSMKYYLQKDGYCPFASPKKLIKIEQGGKEEEIRLTSCKNDDKAIRIRPADNGNTTIPSYEENIRGKKLLVHYTNSPEIFLRLDTPNRVSGDVRVSLHEGLDYTDSNPLLDIIQPQFESIVEIDLRVSFSGESKENGSFTIKVSTKDGLTGLFYGKKNVDIPDHAPLADATLESIAGVPGVISGRNGMSFVVKAECPDEFSMGVGVLDSDQIEFFPCKDNKATIESNSVNFSGKRDQSGGLDTVRLFMRDKYYNVSKDDPIRSNHKEVFVDFGLPDLTVNRPSFAIGFGFIDSDYLPSSGSGTELSFHYFYGNAENASESGLPIPIREIIEAGGAKVVFSQPRNCKQNINTDEDGSDDGDEGAIIQSFAITAPGEAVSEWLECSDGTATTSHSINSSQFPGGEFDLHIKDGAGHISQPSRYNISSCDTATESEVYCW